MTKIRSLTDKQRKFVNVYNGNATESAILAGYGERSAAVMGGTLLKNPLIVRMIKSREESEAKLAILSRQERQAFWSSVARDPEQKMQDRLRASELLGKSECDFTEKLEVDGNIGLSLGLSSILRKIESGGDPNPTLDTEYTEYPSLSGGDPEGHRDGDQETSS